MGAAQSNDCNWELTGRDMEIEKAIEALNGRTNLLQVTGLKKIGKSRVLHEIHKKLSSKWKCQSEDFTNDLHATHCYDTLKKLYQTVSNDDECTDFIQEFPDKSFQCHQCDNCEQNSSKKPLKCFNWKKMWLKAVSFLITSVKSSDKHIVLLLDNVDRLMSSDKDIKDHFLKFVKDCRSERFKIVVSTTKKISLVGVSDCRTMELEPLGLKDTIKLLYVTTDGKDSEELSQDTDVVYSADNVVFTPDNEKCLQCIAILCDGLPLAVIMAGALLMEDDQMFSCVELLEILTYLRMKTLSPDNCPPDDRLDIYSKEMESITSLNEQFTSFFENLNERHSSDFTIKDALEASGEKMTSARMKFDILKKLTDNCILSVKKLSKEHQWRLHSILREANGALTVLRKVDPDSDAKTSVLNFTKENAKKIGLELDDELLSNPKQFEQAIRQISNMFTVESPDPKAVDLYNVDNPGDDEKILNLKDFHSDSCNNLSVGDEDNLNACTEEMINVNNVGMNIREPMEHSYFSRDSIDCNINAVNKVEARYVMDDNNKEASRDSDVNMDFEIGQNIDRLYKFQHTLKADGVKKLSIDDASPIVKSQADKLSEYNRIEEDPLRASSSLNLSAGCKLNNDIVNNHTNCKNIKDSISECKSTRQTSGETHNKTTDGTIVNVNMCNDQLRRNITTQREEVPMAVQQQTWFVLSRSDESQDLDQKCATNVLDIGIKGELCTSDNYRTCACDRCCKLLKGEYSGGTNHLGNCPIHGLSISEHSVCSCTGPPAIKYEPPTQYMLENPNISLREPSMECLTVHDLPVSQNSQPPTSVSNSAVPVNTPFMSYNSMTGPSAMSYPSQYTSSDSQSHNTNNNGINNDDENNSYIDNNDGAFSEVTRL
ncbi:hypothetical protein ACF0H5_008238 [Mactra antiquata]